MNFACKRCGKEFTRKYNLEVHYKKKIKCDNKHVISEIDPLVDSSNHSKYAQNESKQSQNEQNFIQNEPNHALKEINFTLKTTIKVPNMDDPVNMVNSVFGELEQSNNLLNLNNEHKKIHQCSICLKLYSSECALRKYPKKELYKR